jgi:hypothetical protein
MTTYSSRRPIRITGNSDDVKYLDEHVTHFFNTISYNIIKSFAPEDKERFFKMVTDHENIITKLYGQALLDSIIFLPVALKKGTKDKLVEEYKIWLEKQ